jgi:hypothetical protein
MATAPETFDITSIETAESGFLHLKHPATEETISLGEGNNALPVGITYHAPGSKPYVAADLARTNRQLLRNRRGKKVTAEDLRADNHQFFADVTISFDNLSYGSASDVTGKKLFLALYSDPKYGWAVDQLNAKLNEWSDFTTTSPTN